MIVSNSNIAFDLLKKNFNPYQEEVFVICLDSQLRLLGYEMIFKGTVDSCLFHARDIFRYAISKNAHSLIIAHNHPSLKTLPSTADKKITRKLIKIAQLLEIPLLDHIIFCPLEFYSMSEKKRTIVPQS